MTLSSISLKQVFKVGKKKPSSKKKKAKKAVPGAVKAAVKLVGKTTRKAKKVAKKTTKKASKVVKNGTRLVKEEIEDLTSFSTTKLFPVTKNFKFPEEQIKSIAAKPSLGVAFSGGGTRSASATLGQLRGLKAIGLLSKVKYISCVSGGSWAATPFTYLQKKEDEDRFLGRYVDPSKIRTKSKTPRAETIEPVDKKSLAHAISNSPMVLRCLKHMGTSIVTGQDVDETFARAVGEGFLKPFGLGDPRKFYTWNKKTRDEICKRNKHLSAKEFYTTERDRPYLIGAGTLHQAALKMYHMEYTPLYTGVSVLHKKKGKRGQDIGGGYIEPIGFDSRAPKNAKSGMVNVKLGRKFHRFSMSDSIGSNGAAPMIVVRLLKPIFSTISKQAKTPQAKLVAKGIELLLGSFPNFRYWPLTNVGKTKEEKYDFGDAGVMDSFGIMPLLKRGVKNIVVFINTADDFGLFEKKKRLKKGTRYNRKTKDKLVVDPDLLVLFGKKVKGLKLPKLLEKSNQVFSGSDGSFDRLINAWLEARDEGRGLVHRDTYRVKANNHYGVKAYTANILWVYNHEIPEWSGQLSKEVSDQLPSDFPCYSTFLSNTNIKDLGKRAKGGLAKIKDASLDPWGSLRKVLTKPVNQKKADVKRFLDNCPAIIDLTPQHVELLAHMHAWNIVDNKSLFQSMNPKKKR